MTDAPASTPDGLARDRVHVEREYGVQKWPAVARLIERHAAAEPTGSGSLARVHRLVARDYAYSGDPLATIEVQLGGARQQLPAAIAIGGAERLLADSVVDLCTPRTDLVIELGCGWGWHVLGAWLSGGPRDAFYVGAEFTAAGRGAAERLAGLEPALSFRAHDFDYHDPATLSSLGTFREAVVFTAHSIEQIPQLSRGLVQAIAGLAPTVRCLHFEPVGWQVDEDIGGGSSRAYAERHDYSRNLVSVLRDEEAAGALRIDAIETNVFGLNPDNATTIVRWSAGA